MAQPLSQRRLRTPDAAEIILALWTALVFFIALSMRRGERLAKLEAVLAARPLVVSEKHVDLDKTVTRAAGRRVKATVTAPDGTKTVTVTTDAGPSVVRVVSQNDEKRAETPICAPSGADTLPWRYARLTLDPEQSLVPRALAGGVTLWGRFDVGVSYDWRYSAAGVEIGVRF